MQKVHNLQIFICIEDRFRDNDLSFRRDVKPHHERNIRYKFEKSFLCALIQYLNAKTKVCKYGAARYSFSVNVQVPRDIASPLMFNLHFSVYTEYAHKIEVNPDI